MNRLAVLRSAFLAAVCLFSASVQANIITVKFDGFSQGKMRIKQTLDGTARNAQVGMFDLDLVSSSGVADWLAEQSEIQAFCVELDQFLTTRRNAQYTLMSGIDFFSDRVTVDMVGRLYTGHFQSVKDQTTAKSKRIYSTAFQLALWEIVYDTNSHNLTGDRYQMQANRYHDVRAKANEFLASLSGITNQFSVFVLQSDTSQDLLVVSPTPPSVNGQRTSETVSVSEPTTLATFTLALLVLARRSFKRK